MSNIKDKKWLSEYEAFLKSEEVKVPTEISERVFSRMEKLINPNAWLVFAKISGIHLAVGFLSLGICHQFNMNPFGTKYSIAEWFMAMGGHSICMILCGGLFLGLSVFVAGYFLTIEEVKALKRTEFIQTLSLSVASLTVFAFFGGEFAVTFAGLWLLGALMGGFAATEIVWKMKSLH